MHHSNAYGVKGMNIKCLRFDGRGDYFSNEFNEYNMVSIYGMCTI
jgi:hypothetical protein